jgi:hypothetical protein
MNAHCPTCGEAIVPPTLPSQRVGPVAFCDARCVAMYVARNEWKAQAS